MKKKLLFSSILLSLFICCNNRINKKNLTGRLEDDILIKEKYATYMRGIRFSFYHQLIHWYYYRKYCELYSKEFSKNCMMKCLKNPNTKTDYKETQLILNHYRKYIIKYLERFENKEKKNKLLKSKYPVLSNIPILNSILGWCIFKKYKKKLQKEQNNKFELNKGKTYKEKNKFLLYIDQINKTTLSLQKIVEILNEKNPLTKKKYLNNLFFGKLISNILVETNKLKSCIEFFKDYLPNENVSEVDNLIKQLYLDKNGGIEILNNEFNEIFKNNKWSKKILHNNRKIYNIKVGEFTDNEIEQKNILDQTEKISEDFAKATIININNYFKKITEIKDKIKTCLNEIEIKEKEYLKQYIENSKSNDNRETYFNIKPSNIKIKSKKHSSKQKNHFKFYKDESGEIR